MTEIDPYLERLGLLQYRDVFTEEGFDTWETLLDIQETDLEALGVKLGHRRKLQRAIAEYRGFANVQPLGSPLQDNPNQETSKPETSLSQVASGKDTPPTTSSEPKRRYRRHPKADENAPEKPPSAYVLFSNKTRDEVKQENLSFTEMARLVGERWQKLESSKREPFESHAAALKEIYHAQMAEYRKTNAFKEYAQYLADFKAKHGPLSEPKNEPKRPKLEGESGTSYMSTSTAENTEASSQASLHTRGGSISSMSHGHAAQITTGPQHSLQVVTSLPNLSSTGRRRVSPTYQYTHERHLTEFISIPNSLSEESVPTRPDQADVLPRAATLSLNTPPSGTPPPNIRQHNIGRIDFGYGPAPPSWSRRGLSNIMGSTSPGDSPTKSNTTQALTSSLIESPRERIQDLRRISDQSLQHQGRLQQQAAMKGMPISQLVSPNVDFEQQALATSQRILPPPYPMAVSQPQHTGLIFGRSPTRSPVSHFQPIPERLPLPQRHSASTQSRSDDEAANALADLADSRSSSRTQNPRSTQ